MTQVCKRIIKSWSEMRIMAESFDVARGFQRAYVFRGHADADWPLAPTLHRSASLGGTRIPPTTEELLLLEDNLLGKFRQQAPEHLPLAILQFTQARLDWWTVMRHYGAPTRILDWTASFYVAAYFAAAEAPEKDAAIYVLHIHTLDKTMDSKHGNAGKFSAATTEDRTKDSGSPNAIHILDRATALLDRMISQQCCFMSSLNVATDIEKELADSLPSTTPENGVAYQKIIVPAACKPEIMRRLRAMNITAATLFPGLDGIGRALNELVRFP